MYRIDVPSASPTLPAATAAGAAGYFTDGDPVGGQPATILPAEFMNMVMMELLNIVTAGGLAPSKADRTQVLTALQNMLGIDFLAANPGYVLHHGTGLRIQWGTGTHGDGSGAQAVVFPVGFTTACMFTIAGNAASGPPTAFHGTTPGTLTGMTVYSATAPGTAAGAGTAFRWLAIGK